MAFDLLDTLKNLFNQEFSQKAATQLGESESSVQKALGGIIPAILTGLLHKAGTTTDAGGLADMVKEISLAGNLPGKGADILRSLFGNRAGQVTGTIARYAGIKESSADTLLQTAAPATVGVVGQQAGGEDLNATSLLSFLNNQKEAILHAVPAGLGLKDVLGIGNLGDISRKLTGPGDVTGVAESRVRTRWIWMLIFLVAVLLLLWYWLRGCNTGGNTNTMDSVTTGQMEDSAIDAVMEESPARESIKVTLPDGKVLEAYKGGIEDQLVTFLKDPDTKGGKDQWFDFDNLNFRTGSAELTEESQLQVQNLVAILHAFPKTKVKIGGYTDRVGDSVANMRLSQERADAVLRSLQAGNVRPVQLMGAEGYGSMFAKAAADAPNEERKLDRRISVGVREK
ncbi:DUF937 domain-containing protein [Chitinophaga cymbidii]|uniref:OmpA-like domain-containing protein n=1 Tax=Chitinophaga cymbidii TaxID=1096750 RepID=A0A512RR32_9BACT|nr:DUF937 domain-containing protein [Chitinophaga cymbidii]GEP98126.1 hypothetical protein CCY01nite_43860 [Chitinophaga cymbidii]